MDLLYNFVLVLHFLGLAGLIGGCLVQFSAPGERSVLSAMMYGALTQVVTGPVLVGLAEGVESLDKDLNMTKIAVKLGIALVVTVLCWVNRRRPTIPDGLYLMIFGLAVTNVVVAVFWT